MSPDAAAIDCQCHWYPTEFCTARLNASTYPRSRQEGDGYVFEVSEHETLLVPRHFHDLDVQLEVMREAGVGTLICSPVVLGDVSSLPPSEATEVATLLHESFATAQRAHPGAFYGLAALPLQDVSAATDSLENAIVDLGLRGVLLHSNADGRSIARTELWPLYERIEQLAVPIFLHPTRAFQIERVRDYRLERPLAYLYDTSIAAMSLIVSGVLDKFPSLRIVHPHLGGTLPYLLERLEEYHRLGFWDLREPIRSYLRRFHTDTVSGSQLALAQALDVYGLDRMLFSSDFPYFQPADGVRFVRENFKPDEARQVLTENARTLLSL
jgi:predicted TIM-barrel fold metal-dependent hydrolase